MFSIISAGIAPSFALLSYFYLKDEFDKEPIMNITRAFFLGSILVLPIMFIQYVIEVEQVLTNDFLRAFISVGFLEEFFKWFILFYTVFKFTDFDEHYDGIVYGVSLSLGFATVENILYLLSYGLEHALGRAFLPVSSHALFGVIMGYYIGKAKFSQEKHKHKWIWLAFLVPFLLHSVYDLILLVNQAWLLFMIPFMLFLWWFALRKVKKAKASHKPYSHKENPLSF
jgi:protease PrsW